MSILWFPFNSKLNQGSTVRFLCFLFVFVPETRLCYVTQTCFSFRILLPHPPDFWDYISVGCHVLFYVKLGRPHPPSFCAQGLGFKTSPLWLLNLSQAHHSRLQNGSSHFKLLPWVFGWHSPPRDSIQSPPNTKNSGDLVKSLQEVMI